MAGVRSGPALVEFDEEKRVGKRPAVDDGVEQVDEGHHQAADQEERYERTQVGPGHSHPVPQPAESPLLPSVGGVAAGARQHIGRRRAFSGVSDGIHKSVGTLSKARLIPLSGFLYSSRPLCVRLIHQRQSKSHEGCLSSPHVLSGNKTSVIGPTSANCP